MDRRKDILLSIEYWALEKSYRVPQHLYKLTQFLAWELKRKTMDSPKLPVVDLSGEDLRPGTETWISTSKQVCQALEEYGCFVIKCNQVSLNLYNAIYSAALQDLFNLPKEIKELIKSSSEQPYRDVFSNNPNHEGIATGDIISTPEAIHQFSNLLWPAGNDRFWYLSA